MSATRKLRKLGIKLAMKLKRLKDFAVHHDPVDALLDEVRAARPEPALEARVVVITGSSEGVGFTLAQAFLQKGARVVINGRRAAVLNAAAAKLGEADRVLAVCADISTEAGAKALLEQTLQRFGTADVLVNNAGVMGPQRRKAWEMSADDWARTLAVNLTGPFLCAATFMRWMVAEGVRGRVINVSSGAANAPIKGMLPYAVSKSALDALTLNLAADADGTGIAVIGVQLGSTQSEMTRKFFSWADYEALPPPQTQVPVFWYAATADPQLLHGRVIAAWRYLMVREAEARIAMPMAAVERFRFVEQKTPVGIAAVDRIVLNRAENQFGMPERVKALMARANGSAVDLSRYPDADYNILRQRLAAKHALGSECFSFGNGSAELVERVLRVFTKPGEAVLSNDPSWFMFDRFAYVCGVRNDKAPFVPSPTEGFDHNLDGVLAAIRGDTRLIYLISPSNPVGVPLLHEPFMRFLERVPRHIPVVVDEAYVDFVDRADILDTARVVRESDRMVISLRTFSKFYGLAGMRVGYAFAPKPVIDWLDRGELLFNISSFAAEAAAEALQDDEHARRTLVNVSTERQRIGAFLAESRLTHVPTQSNMLLFEPPTAPDTLFDKLERRGIVPARGVVLGKYVLWPVGLPPQNDRFRDVVKSCL
jgi:histidinol-phosphate aminotransferase